tara:strand:+ start:1070 stop:1471 length:402 start_codon:yes stop_codon:yes gene_type:complete
LFWLILTILEIILLILGVSFPLARIDEFWIFTSEFSILSISRDLIIADEFLLGVMVFSFGLLFPLVKIVFRLTGYELINRYNLHKFSMVDIFLISFLVFSAKVSNYFDLSLLIGFYFLISSVLLGYIQIVFNK